MGSCDHHYVLYPSRLLNRGKSVGHVCYLTESWNANCYKLLSVQFVRGGLTNVSTNFAQCALCDYGKLVVWHVVLSFVPIFHRVQHCNQCVHIYWNHGRSVNYDLSCCRIVCIDFFVFGFRFNST